VSSGARVWWFLSFADLNVPEYLERWRGVAIVYARGEEDARRAARRLGAEETWTVKAQQLETNCPSPVWRNRLVRDRSEAEIIAERV
jgi:hypothetical protein